jgi:hypothetical protein
MRALLAVACLALSAGCASLGGMPATDRSGPLRAYLLPHSDFRDGMSFHVSRPAHVAVFRIVPGYGTNLVYPRSGSLRSNRTLTSGFHSVMSGIGIANDRNYMRGVSYASAGPAPEFYFMIASETPLRLDQFGSFGSRLESAMGVSFGYTGSFSAMERLVQLAVPNVSDESWTTDYYVHWPEQPGTRERQRTLVRIACNGAVYNVPVELADWATAELCSKPSVEPNEPADEAPRDAIVEPRRRPPVEVSDRISSVQLSDPEAWEQLRGYAENAAVTRDLRSRGGLNARDFGTGSSGDESVQRSRPTRQTSGSAPRNVGDGGSIGSGTSVDASRGRPAPESGSPPASAPPRERPTPSGDGSPGRALAPTQP